MTQELSLEEIRELLMTDEVMLEPTYKSWHNCMLSRGFKSCPRGLLSFILSREASCLEICNKTMKYIVIAFKYFYFLDQQKRLTKEEETFVEKALQMRRRLYPDGERSVQNGGAE